MKKWTMALCAGLLLFTTATVDAKPNNPNKQHQKAWIAQHKAQKQQEKFQKEQYKAMRKQQKDYEKMQRQTNGVYNDDDVYRNYPQYPTNGGKRQYPENMGKRPQPQQPQSNDGWGLGDILGGIGL